MKILIQPIILLGLLCGVFGSISATRYTDCNYPDLWYAIDEGNVKEYKRLATKKNIESIKYKCKYDDWKEDQIVHGVTKAVRSVWAPGDTWIEILEHMLSLGADPNGKYKEYKKYIAQPPIVELAHQAMNRDFRRASAVRVAKILIAKGADVRALATNNATALHYAAAGNLKELVELLLQNGVDKNIQDNAGHTAAFYAERSGHTEMANFLKGQSNDEYKNSIFYAVKNKNLAQVKNLVNRQKGRAAKAALLNKAEGLNNRTPLYYAAENGSIEIVKFLVENGADVNVTSYGGINALVMAINGSHKELAKFLIENGSNMTLRQTEGCGWGYTPLHWAIIKNWADIVKLMFDKGIDLVQASTDTDPVIAATTTNLSMIKLLVGKGAELTQKAMDHYIFMEAKTRKENKKDYWTKHYAEVLAYLKTIPISASSKVMSGAPKEKQPMAWFETIDVNDERVFYNLSNRKK